MFYPNQLGGEVVPPLSPSCVWFLRDTPEAVTSSVTLIEPVIDAVDPPALPLPIIPEVYVNVPCTSISPVTVVCGEFIVVELDALILAVLVFTVEDSVAFTIDVWQLIVTVL